MVRMSFEGSFKKSNKRLCLEQEVVAVVRGVFVSDHCFIQKIRNICRVSWRKIKQEGPWQEPESGVTFVEMLIREGL